MKPVEPVVALSTGVWSTLREAETVDQYRPCTERSRRATLAFRTVG